MVLLLEEGHEVHEGLAGHAASNYVRHTAPACSGQTLSVVNYQHRVVVAAVDVAAVLREGATGCRGRRCRRKRRGRGGAGRGGGVVRLAGRHGEHCSEALGAVAVREQRDALNEVLEVQKGPMETWVSAVEQVE